MEDNEALSFNEAVMLRVVGLRSVGPRVMLEICEAEVLALASATEAFEVKLGLKSPKAALSKDGDGPDTSPVPRASVETDVTRSMLTIVIVAPACV